MDTLADLVRSNARRHGDRAALVAGHQTLTFTDLDRRSNQVANGLADAGVGPGDRVAFLDRNAVEHFDLLFACGKLDAVTVPVSWRLAPTEVAHVLDDSRAEVLVVNERFLPTIRAAQDGTATSRTVIVVGDHRAPEGPWYRSWIDAQPTTDPDVGAGPDDVGVQMYTSGTTGRPKGVMLTNRNVLGSLRAACDVWGFTEASVNLIAMPLFHIGATGWALAGMLMGGLTVLLAEYDPHQVRRSIADHRVTHLFLVPAAIRTLLDRAPPSSDDRSSLDVVVYGAAPMPRQDLVQAIDVLGGRFIQAYGLTETAGAVAALGPEDHDLTGPNTHRLAAAGRPLPGVELRIGDGAPGATAGEILVRSDKCMKGYWANPEATAAAFADGWLRTGDIGEIDDDGYLYVRGRLKDMIITGGENVYPAEVEDVLVSHPAVAEAALVGRPSTRWGETPIAVVVAADGATVSAEQLITFCRARLAHYKCPTAVHVVDELPRTSSGKVMKHELRDLVEKPGG